MRLEEYQERFEEEPGYLDFARIGPLGRSAREESVSLGQVLATARFGSLATTYYQQQQRMKDAVAAVGGFRPDQVVFQPNTSQGLMHTMFGLTGGIALSPREFPAVSLAVQRAASALGVLSPVWLDTEADEGRVTPATLRDQVGSAVAVAVSLVDYRTGYLVDLEGIRQVIGDRLLIVDATQGFGVVDAPFEVTDVVVAGGQKWPRAGMGTGFLAMSDRAREHLTPVWSGFTATEGGGVDVVDGREVPPPAHDVSAFAISHPDPIACARLAAACEEIAHVGVGVLNSAIAERVSRLIDLADEYAIPVVSPRAEAERAGIVVLEPDNLTVLAASLHNHGVTATVRESTVRLSAHVTTDEETFAMLRAALVSYATTV